MNFLHLKKATFFAITLALVIGCSGDSEKAKKESKGTTSEIKADENDWRTNKGIGPIATVTLEPKVNVTLSEEGKAAFELKCSACHKLDKRYIGPSPQDIFERRTPEWIMNMILNPDGMVAEDPIAKQLLREYNGTPMANQNLTQEEARAILEFFRTLNSN